MKKYELTKTTKNWCGRTLYQIKALKEFGNVSKGELGGYIEKEDNLSQDDNAWVYNNAWVYDNAMVYDNARVYDNAWVYGDANVSGNARVYGDARVSCNAWVYDNARVYGNAWVYGDADVFGNARVYGKIKLEFGQCFGGKRKDWNVTELENEEEILLIANYKPAIEETTTELTLQEIADKFNIDIDKLRIKEGE